MSIDPHHQAGTLAAPSPRSHRPAGLLVGVVALLAVVAIGCSSDSDEGSTSTCADIQTVADDVRAVTQVNVISQGTDALGDALDQLRQSLDKLAEDAGDQLRPTVETLESSVSSIGDTLSSLGSRPIQESASTLQADVQQISQAFQELSTDAEQELSGCDIQ